ncbi:MAG: hypothetical protein MJA31_19550 [Clostridia bacterium]|nr:hypothetical protein [Clostridia bacterium]
MLTVSKLNEKNLQAFQSCLSKNGIPEVKDIIYNHQNYFVLKDKDEIIGYTYFKNQEKDISIKEIEIFNSKEEKILMIDLLIKSVINAADMRGMDSVVIDESLLKNNVDWLQNMGFEQKDERGKFYMDVKKFFARQCNGCNKDCTH